LKIIGLFGLFTLIVIPITFVKKTIKDWKGNNKNFIKFDIMNAQDIEEIFYIWLIVMAVLFIIGSILFVPKKKSKPAKQHHSPHPLIRMIEGYDPNKYIEDK
jgi:H+/Cl- antiporter ClcA